MGYYQYGELKERSQTDPYLLHSIAPRGRRIEVARYLIRRGLARRRDCGSKIRCGGVTSIRGVRGGIDDLSDAALGFGAACRVASRLGRSGGGVGGGVGGVVGVARGA